MPDRNGKFRGISVPNVPWRVSWTQADNKDGTFTRTYHEVSGDRVVVLDPKAKDQAA